MRRASLTKFLDCAGDRQREPGLVGEIGDDLHVLERPGERDHVPFLERVRGARAHQQRCAQLDKIDAGGLREPAGFDQAHGVDPQQQVVHGLADLAMADLAEMGIIRAETAIDGAAALDHVGLAADQRQQRSLVRCETPTADRGVENAHALRLRALVQRLDGIGLGGRRHRDDRARRELGKQSLRSEHDLVDLVVVADADNDEIGGACDLGRSLDRRGAGLACLGQLLVVDVAGGHGGSRA
jgi:hypothetical protein